MQSKLNHTVKCSERFCVCCVEFCGHKFSACETHVFIPAAFVCSRQTQLAPFHGEYFCVHLCNFVKSTSEKANVQKRG